MPAPTGISAKSCNLGSSGFPEIVITWEDNDSDSYNVYESRSGGSFNLVGSTVGGLTFFRQEGLISSTNYSYVVRGVLNGIESSDSFAASVTTEDATNINPPSISIVSSVITPTTVKLTFQDIVTKFVVYRSSDNGITYKRWSHLENSVIFYDEYLNPGSTYIYRYAGIQFETGVVSEVSITTPSRPIGSPVEPIGLSVVPGINGILLSWTNPASSVIEIQRSYSRYDSSIFNYGPVTWTTINTTSPGATSYTDSLAAQREGVYYRIRSVVGINVSDYVTPFQKMISTPSTYNGVVVTQVGPGTPNPVPSDSILNGLGPGDTLEIHWDGSNPLRWILLLANHGTASHPITIKGVRHANGTRPVISGDNATEYGGLSPQRGYYLIGVTTKSSDLAGYKPGGYRITGLEIKDSRDAYTFNLSEGGTQEFYQNSSGILVKTALDVTVDDCYIHNNANGIRQGTGQSDRYYSRTLTIRNNTFNDWGNLVGTSDTFNCHGIYLDGENNLIENNSFGLSRTGTNGLSCKTRGPNTIIRNNKFDSSIKFIDMIDSGSYCLPHILRSPNYHRGEVCGNEFFMGTTSPSRAIVFGFDIDYFGGIRGPFYVHGNTFASVCTNTNTTPTVKLFRTNQSSYSGLNVGVVEWGNAFMSINSDGGTPRTFTLTEGEGVIQHGYSWYSEPPIDSGRTGSTTGLMNIFSSPPTNGGMIDPNNRNFGLNANSQLIDAWRSGPTGIAESNYEPLGVARVQSGSTRDLGAYEYVAVIPPGDETIPAFNWPPFFFFSRNQATPPPGEPIPAFLWPPFLFFKKYNGPIVEVVQRSSTDSELLNSIRDLIIAGGYSASIVNISLEPEPFPRAGSPQIVIVPDTSQFQAPTLGGAPWVNTEYLNFSIGCVAVQGRDPVQTDSDRLTRPLTGIYGIADNIKKILQYKFLQSSNGDYISVLPIEYERRSKSKPYGGSYTWNAIELDFRVLYNRVVVGETD